MFRQGVAIIVINDNNKVLLLKRKNYTLEGDISHLWQVPQGGVEEGETPEQTALRELYEETGISSVEVLKRMEKKTRYILPEWANIKYFDGQEQTWFLVKFTGDDSEINLEINPEEIEFTKYKWANPKNILKEIINFKKESYKQALKEFFNV